MPLKANIVILNYNGRELLERFMPSILREAAASRRPCGVTIIDNSSADSSVAFLREKYPKVKLVECPNKVLVSFNDVVRGMTEDVVILLNNDMELLPGFVDPLVDVFENDSEAFSAATHGDRSAAVFRWGMLGAEFGYPGYGHLIEKPGYTFSTGAAAFDRLKFLEIGGYDDLYLPGRYEDVDLCFRGWKRGWKGYYEPRSRVNHIGGASFEKAFDSATTQAMVFRNGCLFMIKNITDSGLMARFIALTLVRSLLALVTGRWFILKGLFGVFPRLGAALAGRRRVRPQFVKSDREIIETINRDIPKQAASVRRMRGVVEFLGARPAWRKPFFVLGFPTVRLAFPVQFLLLRELIETESVLDLGCGKHSMVPIIPARIRKVGVEYFEPAYVEASRKARHHEVIHADVTGVDFPAKSFDAVVLLDVIEHLPKEEGERLIARMETWARKKVIVFTPNGFLHQDHYDENPLMEHKSGWTPDDFRSRGFRVHGVNGFKALKKDAFDHDAKPTLKDRLVDLTQIATYHKPEWAYQLFCVKDLR